MRYYGVFAVNMNDPSDILGYELTGCGRRWSRGLVELISDDSDGGPYRSSAQSRWNWARELADEGRRRIRGYRVFVCRINSRHCPVKVDITCHSQRYYRQHPEEYDPHAEDNGRFSIAEEVSE